jgi:hypothetical protein
VSRPPGASSQQHPGRVVKKSEQRRVEAKQRLHTAHNRLDSMQDNMFTVTRQFVQPFRMGGGGSGYCHWGRESWGRGSRQARSSYQDQRYTMQSASHSLITGSDTRYRIVSDPLPKKSELAGVWSTIHIRVVKSCTSTRILACVGSPC